MAADANSLIRWIDSTGVDLKGLDGGVKTIRVANPAKLKDFRVGDGIVVTLSRVMAISLDHESATR